LTKQDKNKSIEGIHQFMRDKAEEIAHKRQRMQYERKIADRDKLMQELHVHQIELELQNEELRQSQAKLEHAHQQYLDLYNEAPMGYASLDKNGIITRTNLKLASMLSIERHDLMGHALAEYMLTKDQAIFRSRFNAFANQPENKFIDIGFKKGLGVKHETMGFIGRIQGRRLKTTKDTPNGSEILLVIITDVTELKKSEERIHYQAYHDELTGIPNRASLYDRLESALALTKRRRTYGALLFMDLDRFKHINDSLGHHIGDLLLIEFSKRLRTHIRREDLLVRMGGDEFVILLAEQHSVSNITAVSAQRFAEHIIESLSEPLVVESHTFQVSLSIGINIFPFHQEDNMDDVVRQADTAMYHAKNDGRGLVRFFHAGMQETARQRMMLESELRIALKEEQFLLHYQPQMASNGKIYALEALIRWKHPSRGMISPHNFISIAEDLNMIVPMGEWVIEQTVKQIITWRKQGVVDTSLRFALNVSPKQLESEHFCERVEAIMERYELDPATLVFEITESLLIPNNQIATDTLKHLSELGITFSVDDFGTGFSSLATMQTAPIGQLKIDKRFIRDLNSPDSSVQSSRSHALVSAILSLGHALALEVVAEGVETEEQSHILKQLGCQYMQGYYYSKPLPADEIPQALKWL
jgi:diguanylate cyclase (GGDEF)-like protein